MNINISWELITLILAVFGHAFTTVRSYTRMEVKITTMTESLNRIDRELEKRDQQISAIWKRLDEVRDC